MITAKNLFKRRNTTIGPQVLKEKLVKLEEKENKESSSNEIAKKLTQKKVQMANALWLGTDNSPGTSKGILPLNSAEPVKEAASVIVPPKSKADSKVSITPISILKTKNTIEKDDSPVTKAKFLSCLNLTDSPKQCRELVTAKKLFKRRYTTIGPQISKDKLAKLENKENKESPSNEVAKKFFPAKTQMTITIAGQDATKITVDKL